MTSTLFVFSNPVAGRDDEYNAWYDGTHLPELLAIPGFIAAQRFSSAPVDAFAGCPQGYLATYELEGDGQEAMAAMFACAGSGELHMSDALDSSSVVLWLFGALTERVMPAPS